VTLELASDSVSMIKPLHRFGAQKVYGIFKFESLFRDGQWIVC